MCKITTFSRADTMLACELTHQVTQGISPCLASLIRNELGAPSFHSRVMDAWYAKAHLEEVDVPFALRCDRNGNWAISVPMELESALAECVGSLVPGIEFEVIPVGGRVASR
jgi:hypothetical protein